MSNGKRPRKSKRLIFKIKEDLVKTSFFFALPSQRRRRTTVAASARMSRAFLRQLNTAVAHHQYCLGQLHTAGGARRRHHTLGLRRDPCPKAVPAVVVLSHLFKPMSRRRMSQQRVTRDPRHQGDSAWERGLSPNMRIIRPGLTIPAVGSFQHNTRSCILVFFSVVVNCIAPTGINAYQ